MDELMSNQSKINYKNKISWISGDAKLIDQNRNSLYHSGRDSRLSKNL